MRNHYLENQRIPSPYIDDEVFSDNQREGNEDAIEECYKENENNLLIKKRDPIDDSGLDFAVWHNDLLVDDCLSEEHAGEICLEILESIRWEKYGAFGY